MAKMKPQGAPTLFLWSKSCGPTTMCRGRELRETKREVAGIEALSGPLLKDAVRNSPGHYQGLHG